MSTRKDIRVVCDTNVFVSSLPSSRGNPAIFRKRWEERAFTLITSHDMYDELEETVSDPRLRKFGMTEEKIQSFLLYFVLHAEFAEPLATKVKVRDPDDQMVLETALSGYAHYLVTGDKDLLTLRDHEHIAPLHIMTVSEFLQTMDEQ